VCYSSCFGLPTYAKSELLFCEFSEEDFTDFLLHAFLLQERLLELVAEERERSQTAVKELIAEERIKLQVVAFTLLDYWVKTFLFNCQ